MKATTGTLSSSNINNKLGSLSSLNVPNNSAGISVKYGTSKKVSPSRNIAFWVCF